MSLLRRHGLEDEGIQARISAAPVTFDITRCRRGVNERRYEAALDARGADALGRAPTRRCLHAVDSSATCVSWRQRHRSADLTN